MTIEECRKRKNRFNKILKKLQYKEFSRLSNDDFDLLQLSVIRSIALEQLNIASLKEKGEVE